MSGPAERPLERAGAGQGPARLRDFGLPGLLALLTVFAGNLVFVPLSALLVLAWAHLSRTPLGALGFSRPRNWAHTAVLGLAAGVALKLLMKSVVMPLLGAPPTNVRYEHLAGNAGALPAVLYAMVVGAGFGEEVLYRGFLFERLRTFLGHGRPARAATLALTAGLFAAAHYPEQGLPGAQQAAFTGLAFGAMFLADGRLWLPMVAHAAFNLAAVALIYWKLERAVAGWWFG